MELKTLYKTVNKNGEHSCGDIDISKEEWYDLLQKEEAQSYIDVLLCFLREPEHKGTCSLASLKYGKPAAYYNSKITHFSKWVQKQMNRFRVKDTDESDVYWCITMQKGKNTKEGFQWQLRNELVEALQTYLTRKLIDTYRLEETTNVFEEEYKWDLLDKTEGKDTLSIIKSLRGQNIVDNARVDSALKKLWETNEDGLIRCIDNLFDESTPLVDRLAAFKSEMRALCPTDWKVCANDERTAAALLMCKIPEKYTVYKDEIYQLLCQYWGIENRKAGLKFCHFTEIIDRITVEYGEEIQQMMFPQIEKYRNKPLNLAVQTLLWQMKDWMKKSMSKTDEKVENTISINEETMPQQRYKEYIELLKETHNLILTGAPGTGKTYMAQEIAKEMEAVTMFVQFHPSYDYTDFVEGLRPVEKNDGQLGFERRDGVFKAFCRQAIKNMMDSKKSIENLTKEISWQEKLDRFVEDAIEKETTFTTVNGSEFMIIEMRNHTIIIHNEQNEKTTQVAVNADEILELLTEEVPLNIVRDIRNYFNRKFSTQPDSYAFALVKAVREMKQKISITEANKIDLKPFVFIIDEINRGEASKIFGELFYAIDPGYRGKTEIKVQTQYQNLVPETDVFAKGFYVPENVYILATMNDIDRSVESMDFAMRRRFTWKEVTPDDTVSMLDCLPCKVKAKEMMASLNKVIAETDGLGVAYQIGPSYFLRLGENGGDFKKLWDINIEPLLREYLRGFRKADDILQKLNEAYFNAKELEDTNIPELRDED